MTDYQEVHTLSDEDELRHELERHGVPPHLRDGLLGYVLHHRPTGDHLRAVISNDLLHALGYADLLSHAGIHNTVKWCYGNIPGIGYGSPEAYRLWTQHPDKKGEAEAAK